MKKINFIILFIMSGLFTSAQTTLWGVDASHAKIGFAISHFGISETEGKFTKYEGIVKANRPDFSDAKVQFVIDANSITTQDEKRDQHLRSADFFDVNKFPDITFISSSIQATEKNKFKMTGNITMHGVTKEIALDVVYKGTVIDPYKNTKAGFRISGELDRTEFGLVWNGKLAAGELLVGNTVNLDINLELIKK